jgi:hypothetical protein
VHHKTDIDWLKAECARTESLTELGLLAISELRKFPEGSEIVSGPISTGGRGSIETNLKVFSETIVLLQKNGRPIFNQMPYEDQIFLFRKRWWEGDPARTGKYYMPILEDFYLPIFEQRMLNKAWFIPGWESSFGARWERERLVEIGVEICDLDNKWVDELLAKS